RQGRLGSRDGDLDEQRRGLADRPRVLPVRRGSGEIGRVLPPGDPAGDDGRHHGPSLRDGAPRAAPGHLGRRAHVLLRRLTGRPSRPSLSTPNDKNGPGWAGAVLNVAEALNLDVGFNLLPNVHWRTSSRSAGTAG